MAVNPCLQEDWEENWSITHFLYKESPSSSLCVNAENSSWIQSRRNTRIPSWGRAGARRIRELHPTSDSPAPRDGQQGQTPPGLCWAMLSPCPLPKPRQEGPTPGNCCGRNAFPTGSAGILVSTKKRSFPLLSSQTTSQEGKETKPSQP